ncbi:myoneurin-like isoform X2 [Anopheles coustani]|uniref:myoneurin-like isoform X2 n=1 Tax=Anopheles coustani TaxID=139045 RepID=UPI00265B0EFD|nr:myoneurin-like isoform X2 [Anopheles coustani]
MASTTREISNICRFCLCQDDLLPISKAIDSIFTVRDIEHFTGIQITADELLAFAMCESCQKILENSVTFRINCLNNDLLFKELFSVLIESVKDESNTITDYANTKLDCTMIEIREQVDTDATRIDIESIASDLGDTDQMSSGSNLQNQNVIQAFESNTSALGDTDETNAEVKNGQISRNSGSQNKPDKLQSYATKTHLIQTFSNKKKLCPICGKLIINMLPHVALHAKEKQYACPHCNVKMTHRENMKRHIDAVHLKRIVKFCEECRQGFIHQKMFVRHMMSVHGIGRTYDCTICSTTYKLEAQYRTHVNKCHKPPKEFLCTKCNMIFNNRNYVVHQRVHSDVQPYACSKCTKRFKSSYARRTHELTHTGIRFSCELCDKSYRYKSLLNMHYRKEHNGAKSSDIYDDGEDE